MTFNRKKSSATKDVDISVNAAYKGVIWKFSKETEDPYYENPDYVITQQLPENEATAASFGFTEPTASEHKEHRSMQTSHNQQAISKEIND